MRLLVPAVSTAVIAVLAAPAFASAPTPDTRTRAPTTTATARGTATTTASTTQVRPQGTTAHGTTAHGAGAQRPPTAALAPRGFVWPLSPRPLVVRRFVQPQSQWAAGHRGVDLAAAVGHPVLSAGDGVVAFSGVIAGRGVVTVRHDDGLRTTYEPIDQRLASGTVVKRGTAIGMMAATPGHCAPASCLHWGAIDGQTYRDPLSLLGFGRPILLPLG